MKRHIIILLVLVLSVNTSITFADTSAEHNFIDIKEDDWFYDAVVSLTGENIVDGVDSDKFDPFVAANREMFITVLWRLDEEPVGYTMLPFSDIHNDWSEEAIRWAYCYDIIQGFSDDKFMPSRLINTEQLISILYRYTKYRDINIASSYFDVNNNVNYSTASPYAKEAIAWAVSNRIIDENGSNFMPKDSVSRAKLCYILNRYKNIIIDERQDVKDILVGKDLVNDNNDNNISYIQADGELIEQIINYAISIGKNPNDIGIYIENLDTDEIYTHNEDKIFIAGSTYKLSLAMLYYDKINEGSVKLTDTYRFDKCDKEGGSWIGRTYDFGTYFNVDTLLTCMIRYSDNCAARMLFKYVGGWNEFHRQASKYSENFDFYELASQGNYITPQFSYDCLKHIYLNSEHYAMLLDDMKNSVGYYIDSKLPCEIAQKPGYIGNNKHCVAIVYGEVPYIISLYTTGGYTEWNLQYMNIIVYNYFNQ